MRKRFLHLVALLAVFAVAGCRGGTVATVEDEEHRLGQTTDVDLSAWLKLSRSELAKLTDKWAAAVKNDQEAARNSSDAVELLPRLRPQVRLPVFQKAAFSAEAGFSLPPYVAPGTHDAAVALHLARFGDQEAALKLADPTDLELRKQIQDARSEKDYPVEWSRLVGLVIASSQLKLAGGDTDAATRLVLIHKQLRTILDTRASRGSLGAVLLPAGRRALILAAKAWRESGQNHNDLAEDIEKAIADWGPVPEPIPQLQPGAAKNAVAAVFGTRISGKIVLALKPEDMGRPLDLMSLPIPTNALAVVAAFLDKNDRLAEIQFTYRAKIEDVYPEAANLAYYLNEAGVPLKGESVEASLYRQTYVGGGLSIDAVRTNRSGALGGWVQVSAAKDPAKPAARHGLRTFGSLDLDRTFEANRLAFVPGQTGPSILVTDKPALKSLMAELQLPIPTGVNLEREKGHDLLAGVQVTWAPEQTTKALEGLLPLLWSAFGNSRVAAVEKSTGAYLGFIWQDEHTQVEMRFPFDDKGPVLIVRDSRGAESLPARAAAANQRGEVERKARLAGGKPDERLPRSLGAVNDYSMEALHLGQSKVEAETLLPDGKSTRRKEFPGGVSLVILSNPLNGSTYWARQILLRYDDDRVTEIRVRYHEGLAPARKGEALLERLNEGKAGAPEAVHPNWAGLWTGMAHPGKPVEWRWQDDLTIRTYRRDAGGSEVVLTDRASADAGKPLGPLAFIQSGVPGCRIGETRVAVRTALKEPAATSAGADIYRQPANSPYDRLLVWYVAGKVSRIVAVHRAKPGKTDVQIATALSQAWGRDVAGLGYIRRQEGAHGHVRLSYFWHDERTRVETFVQEDDQGARLMTDWRSLPLARLAQTVRAPKKLDD
jgi:hypothetical protein